MSPTTTGSIRRQQVDAAQRLARLVPDGRPPAVGVVGYEMEGRRTGVGRYLEGLLGGLADLELSWHWRLFFKGEPFAHPLFARRAANRDQPLFTPSFDRRAGDRPIAWEQLRLPRLLRREPLDVLFSPSYSLPPRPRLPSLVTIHDLSFEHLAKAFPFKERYRRRFLARRASRQATRVLADTDHIAGELALTYHLPPEKIAVVPLGVEARFRPAAAAGPLPAPLREQGVRPPYLLALGTVLARRRLDLVLDAFAAAAARDPELTLVQAGNNRLRRPSDLDDWIAGSGAGDRVLRLGYVDEDHLPALYGHAEGSFYLSSYEGYGLPPLESLATGTPAVVAPGLGLDDLWPEYPYRCEVLDQRSVRAVTERLLADRRQREVVGRAGAERMARLTWTEAALRLAEEIRKALDT